MNLKKIITKGIKTGFNFLYFIFLRPFSSLYCVVFQKRDFKVFKQAIQNHFDTLKKGEKKPTETQRKRFDSYIIEQSKESNARKARNISDWRALIPVVIGSFVYILFQKDKLDLNDYYLAKYVVLFSGMFASWYSAVMVSLRGQEISFIRKSIRSMAEAAGDQDFDFHSLFENYFDNGQGLNDIYRSATKIQTRQMLVVAFFFIGLCIYYLDKDWSTIQCLLNS